MIKCCGGTKCVPAWNICYGNSDCMLNQDGEAACYKCPEYCKCTSYYIECFLREMFSWRVSNMVIKIMKLIVARDTFDFAFLVSYADLVYLDISTSSVTNITDSLDGHTLYKTYLHSFNASGNLLHEMYFINTPFSRFIQVIDLSNNKLLHIVNILPILKILYLKDNLITLILHQNIPNKHDMRFLDLRNNPLRIIHLADIIEKCTSLRYLLSSTNFFCCISPSNVKLFLISLCSSKIVNISFLLFLCGLLKLSNVLLHYTEIREEMTNI